MERKGEDGQIPRDMAHVAKGRNNPVENRFRFDHNMRLEEFDHYRSRLHSSKSEMCIDRRWSRLRMRKAKVKIMEI